MYSNPALDLLTFFAAREWITKWIYFLENSELTQHVSTPASAATSISSISGPIRSMMCPPGLNSTTLGISNLLSGCSWCILLCTSCSQSAGDPPLPTEGEEFSSHLRYGHEVAWPLIHLTTSLDEIFISYSRGCKMVTCWNFDVSWFLVVTDNRRHKCEQTVGSSTDMFNCKVAILICLDPELVPLLTTKGDRQMNSSQRRAYLFL